MFKKMHSRSFTSGFTSGFTSPYTFMFGRRARFRVPCGNTLGMAWNDVGKQLDHAIEVEMSDFVQPARKAKERKQHRKEQSA